VKGRAELVDYKHPKLSLRAQCELLSVSRSSLNYVPLLASPEELKIMRIMDEIYLRDPCIGVRRIVMLLAREHGLLVNRKRVSRLRRVMGIETIYCRPRTSIPDRAHVKFPYLLRGKNITRANEVWCSDITYVPMAHGNAFLCVVMDWYSRKVLGWAVSNTMDVALCLTALARALKACDGVLPEIFNTDQGSQFTSQEWVAALQSRCIAISMDGKGRWMDNVFVERLWRSVKYEDIYLRGYADIEELKAGLTRWFGDYNDWRPHQIFGGATPATIYAQNAEISTPQPELKAAA
jgi:putative transposase